MVPILNAIAKVEHNLNGGQSKPWIVTVQNDTLFEEYVIKLFNPDKPPLVGTFLNKELIASVIAREFDIPTPDPALIYLSDGFIETLEGEDKARVEKIRDRFVFGSKYNPSYADYPPAQNPSTAKYINSATIFAFDVLIRNFDRRKKKPNLLIGGFDYYCIDHEHSLDITKPFIQYDIFNDWSGLKGHLFCEYLKKNRNVEFGEFFEYLRSYNPKHLEDLKEFLYEHQLIVDDLDMIIYYMESVIHNRNKFQNLLNFIIS